jgi:hypothetical protein
LTRLGMGRDDGARSKWGGGEIGRLRLETRGRDLFGSDPGLFDRPASGRRSARRASATQCSKARPSLLRIIAAQTSPDIPQTVTRLSRFRKGRDPPATLRCCSVMAALPMLAGLFRGHRRCLHAQSSSPPHAVAPSCWRQW